MVYLLKFEKKSNLVGAGFYLFNWYGIKMLEGKRVPGQFSVVNQRINEGEKSFTFGSKSNYSSYELGYGKAFGFLASKAWCLV